MNPGSILVKWNTNVKLASLKIKFLTEAQKEVVQRDTLYTCRTKELQKKKQILIFLSIKIIIKIVFMLRIFLNAAIITIITIITTKTQF